MSIQAALDVGFWNRLIGLLSVPRAATIDRVIELASKAPTYVNLDRSQAKELLNLGKLSLSAGKRWSKGGTAASAKPPKVPLPEVPGLRGMTNTRFQAAVLIRGGTDDEPAMPAFFEVDEATPYSTALSELQDYITTQAFRYPRFEEYLKKVMQNWQTGNKSMTVPLWLAERLQ